MWFDTGGSIEDCVFENSRGIACSDPPTGNVLQMPAGTATVLRCRFTDNVGRVGGCALVGAEATLVLEDCLIEGALGESGGAVGTSGDFTARRCIFRNNWSQWTGGALSGRGRVTLEGCIFHDNSCYQPVSHGGAGAITIYDPSTVNLRSCTFFRNGVNGGSDITLPGGSHLTVENSILAFGGGAESGIGPVNCRGTLAELSVRCTDVYGNAGGDWIGCLAGLADQDRNVAADPRFCNADAEDFGLRADSPCAPENAGECGLVGALPVACGTTALGPSTWGQIKGMYR